MGYKFLDYAGVLYLCNKIKNLLSGKADKVHSHSDYVNKNAIKVTQTHYTQQLTSSAAAAVLKLPNYNTKLDSVFVFMNGLEMVKDVEYTVSDDGQVTLINTGFSSIDTLHVIHVKTVIS